MPEVKPLTPGGVLYYGGVAKEALENFSIIKDQRTTLETPVTFAADLKEVLGMLGEPSSADAYVEDFLARVPQDAYLAKHGGQANHKLAFHGLEMLRETARMLAEMLSVRFDIAEAIRQHDDLRGGKADTGAAKEGTGPGVDDKAIERSARDPGAASDETIGRIARQDMASDAEIAASADHGEQRGRFANFPPAVAFEMAKRELFEGITNICRRRISACAAELVAMAAMNVREPRALTGMIGQYASKVSYFDEGKADPFGKQEML